jgi:hypothetical protein
MLKSSYKIKSDVWVYPGPAAWYFISVPEKVTKEIKHNFGALSRGFGSVPVNVTIGKTKWKTSIFPDSKKGLYMLPIKAQVRKKEGIVSGQKINLVIDILTSDIF